MIRRPPHPSRLGNHKTNPKDNDCTEKTFLALNLYNDIRRPCIRAPLDAIGQIHTGYIEKVYLQTKRILLSLQSLQQCAYRAYSMKRKPQDMHDVEVLAIAFPAWRYIDACSTAMPTSSCRPYLLPHTRCFEWRVGGSASHINIFNKTTPTLIGFSIIQLNFIIRTSMLILC